MGHRLRRDIINSRIPCSKLIEKSAIFISPGIKLSVFVPVSIMAGNNGEFVDKAALIRLRVVIEPNARRVPQSTIGPRDCKCWFSKPTRDVPTKASARLSTWYPTALIRSASNIAVVSSPSSCAIKTLISILILIPMLILMIGSGEMLTNYCVRSFRFSYLS